MFAAGLLGTVFGAGGTLAYFEYTGALNVRGRGKGDGRGHEVPQPSVALPAAAPRPTTIAANGPAAAASPAEIMKHFHDLARHGLPSSDNVYVKQGFASSFDPQRRVPRWVLELVTPATVESKNATRDNRKFYSNSDVAEPFRATNADYAVGGYSRGHLAAAQFHKDSQTAMDATFDLSLNVVPQDMASNATDWLRVEQLCKKLAKEFERLYVVTGPLYLPNPASSKPPLKPGGPPRKFVEYEVVGNHEVAVPTHLFKAVLGEAKDGTRSFASFVVPNRPLPDERPLTAFLTPKEELERMTGLQFFPKLFFGGAAGGGGGGGATAAAIGQLCAKTKCEASAGGFGSMYRDVAKLKVAQNRAQLEQAWQQICQAKGGAQPDERLRKEYEAVKGQLPQPAKHSP